MRILVVDDDPTLRGQLEHWLTQAGHECHTAGPPREALALAEAVDPDTAIVNIDDRSQGLWLARELRQRTDDIGVILTTEEPSFAAGVAAMRMGANDYLLKPCSQREILDAIERVLAWRSAVQRDRSGRELIQEALSIMRARPATPAADGQDTPFDGLIAALRARVPEVYRHSRRVAGTAARLARALGLTPSECEDVRQAAWLHDIGKLALADALPAPEVEALTDVEFRQASVKASFDLVSPIPSLRRHAHVVVAIEEAVDGDGYPAGLAGLDIPIGARIIAVADAFDRLTRAEPEGYGLTVAEAYAALWRAAGREFDADVVRALLGRGEGLPC